MAALVVKNFKAAEGKFDALGDLRKDAELILKQGTNKMKKIIPTLTLIPALLIGCGMSDTERQNLASVTCSIISETRNMDSAVRVEKINDARTALGEDPYLDGDDGIARSLKWGVCEELVLNDPDYDTKLIEKITTF